MSPGWIFCACSSNVNLTVVCPPSVISFDETVRELILLLTSPAFTTSDCENTMNNNGKNISKKNFANLLRLFFFIFFSYLSPNFYTYLYVKTKTYKNMHNYIGYFSKTTLLKMHLLLVNYQKNTLYGELYHK